MRRTESEIKGGLFMKLTADDKQSEKCICRKLEIIGAIVFAAIQISAAQALASDLVIPLELPQPNFIGVGVGGYPDYFGSDDTAFGGIPIGRVSLGGERSISLLATDIRINLFNSTGWRMGPEFFYRFGREDVDDAVVRKVHEIDNSAELGLFGGYSWKDPQEIRKQAGFSVWGLWDVSSKHEGWTAGAGIYGMYPVAQPVTIVAGAGTTYGSEEYTDTYFGVSVPDSLASGLLPYSADGGMRDARAWAVAILHLSPQWHTGIGLMYARLLGDAADSPIVAERGVEDQWLYGAGLLYSW